MNKRLLIFLAAGLIPFGLHGNQGVHTLRKKLVAQSDLIVIGRLTIVHTRDGHQGTISVDEVIFGDFPHKSLAFISEPVPLLERQKRIWFLAKGNDSKDRLDKGLYRILVTNDVSSVEVSQIDAIRDLVAELKAGPANKSLKPTNPAQGGR